MANDTAAGTGLPTGVPASIVGEAPGPLTGRELGERLEALRPNTKIMYMSGYTDDVLRGTGALAPGMSFLAKPLRPEMLAARVREALDAPTRRIGPQ